MFCSKILYDFLLVHRAEWVCSIEVLVMLSRIKSLLTNTTFQAISIPHEVSFEMLTPEFNCSCSLRVDSDYR